MSALRRILITGTCAAAAVLPSVAANAESTVPPQDRNYLIAAHQTNLTEIALGYRAQAMTSCPKIQEMSATLLADHMRLDQMDTAAADQLGVQLPTLPTQEQNQTILNTSTRIGRDFDAAWIQAELAGHQKAAKAGNAEMASGGSQPVKNIAQQTVPIVQAHQRDLAAAAAIC
ncbi:DUF4142 domain-containing protein [Nocardia miyunensis]|uniref:DUF4142 domain-containing protein n=1 Tax=Nocardia miyunensis TaxID=282684 RepID=UPI00082E617A|nr:DUF4142 domain-containing protein [Nocardia miyunensis]